MSEFLSEAEVAELEARASMALESRAAWAATPTPAKWREHETAHAAFTAYVEPDDALKLLAERKALREKAEALDAMEKWLRSEQAITAAFTTATSGGVVLMLHPYGERETQTNAPCLATAIRAALAQAEGK